MQKPKNDPEIRTETPPSDHVGERCFSVVRQAAVPCRQKLTANEASCPPRKKRYRPCGRKNACPRFSGFPAAGGARPIFQAAVQPGDICTPVFRRLCSRRLYNSGIPAAVTALPSGVPYPGRCLTAYAVGKTDSGSVAECRHIAEVSLIPAVAFSEESRQIPAPSGEGKAVKDSLREVGAGGKRRRPCVAVDVGVGQRIAVCDKYTGRSTISDVTTNSSSGSRSAMPSPSESQPDSRRSAIWPRLAIR